MQRRRIIMELRNSGKLKGVKPCMIYLKNNMGKIYNEGHADFVMSIKDNTLYFQKLSSFLRQLKPKEDFSLDLRRFKEYAFFQHSFYNVLCLYDKDKRYIEINYNKGIADTFPTEDNVNRIIKVLEEKGIREIDLEKDVISDEESNAKGKEIN